MQDIKLRVVSKDREKQKKPNLQTLLVDEHISSQYRLSLRVTLLSVSFKKLLNSFNASAGQW